MSFVRPQPWTDDDSNLMFQTCDRCGNISIQRVGADGGGAGVWLLGPEAMVMFRAGVPPSQILDYACSDDFARNRGITLSLFRGSLRYMLDLSGAANLLVTRVSRAGDAAQAHNCLEMLHAVLGDFLRRAESGERDGRLNIANVAPLAKIVADIDVPRAVSANVQLDLRLKALDILELCAQPLLWNAMPAEQAALLEQTIDHMEMVEQSVGRVQALAASAVDDPLIRAILVEAKFFHRVFRRRKARLSKQHAMAVWALMRNLAVAREVANPLEPASAAYDALRMLLEHQLVELGFLKLGTGERNGETHLRYRSPETGEVLGLPLYRTAVEVYATPDSTEPSAVLDSWGAALDRL